MDWQHCCPWARIVHRSHCTSDTIHSASFGEREMGRCACFFDHSTDLAATAVLEDQLTPSLLPSSPRPDPSTVCVGKGGEGGPENQKCKKLGRGVWCGRREGEGAGRGRGVLPRLLHGASRRDSFRGFSSGFLSCSSRASEFWGFRVQERRGPRKEHVFVESLV